jgi:hypothetical protein
LLFTVNPIIFNLLFAIRKGGRKRLKQRIRPELNRQGHPKGQSDVGNFVKWPFFERVRPGKEGKAGFKRLFFFFLEK